MTPSTEVATRSEAEIELMRQQAELDAGDQVQTPILKIGQSLTREVQDGEADPGDFIDTLAGESLGTKVEFIVAAYNKGRSARQPKTGRFFTTLNYDVIPETWADLVGEQFVGTRFDEHPDAEETFKREVNDKNSDREWGSGPLISTTYNYTGFVVVPPVEGDEDGEAELRPVRLGLTRSNKKAADRINTLRRTLLRGKPSYDKVFELETEKKQFNSGPAYIIKANLGRETTPEEREEALRLGQAAMSGRVAANDDAAADTAATPATPEGAVAI